jgi:hypothetical protein
MNDYSKITALYSRLSVGNEDRNGGESGRFFDRSAYSRMIEDVENGKIGVCIMKNNPRSMSVPMRKILYFYCNL